MGVIMGITAIMDTPPDARSTDFDIKRVGVPAK